MPIAEMREFAGFGPSTQRYIRRSLDVVAQRDDVIEIWARDAIEATAIKAQHAIYSRIELVTSLIPKSSGLLDAEPMMSPFVTIAGFDLGQGKLRTFSAFRFLYERIFGGLARPWLPSVFMAASGLPHLESALRGELLRSITEAAATAAGWSPREPSFFPSWVDKVELAS